MLIGIIFLALGISLAVAVWSPAFLAAIEVFAVFTLFFVGLIFSLVGYSALKAEREMTEAVGEAVEENEVAENKTAPSSVEV